MTEWTFADLTDVTLVSDDTYGEDEDEEDEDDEDDEEVPPIWKLHWMRTKQAEEEGENPGRRSRGGWRSWDGEERGQVKIWMIQHNFYQSHCFFPVNLKVEVKTSLLPLSLSVFVIRSS